MPTHSRFFRDPNGNPAPAGLRQLGAFLAVEIQVPPQLAALLVAQGQPVPAGQAGLALIDTGATLTCVHQPLLTQLGLNPVGTVQSGTANGTVILNIYPARIVITEAGITADVQAVGVDLTGQVIAVPGQPDQQLVALIGRNLLEQWLLVWNGPGAVWSISV